MQFLNKTLAVVVLVLSANLVHAADGWLEVKKSVEIDADVATVWGKIGDYCAIKDWHPAITACKAYDDHGSYYRNLTLEDGGVIMEKRKEEKDNSYVYFIKKSPFPLKPYKGTFMVEDAGGKTKVTWKANFKPREVSDEEAIKIVEGIFDAGIAGIQDMFK